MARGRGNHCMTSACLKQEMAKWQNGEITKERNSEMTFLNTKNKWLPVFLLLLLCPVAISLHSKNRQNSAQHVKTHKSCCAITFVTFCSWPIFIIPRVSPLPRGFSVFKMVSASASPPPAKKSFNTCHALSSRARWPLESNFCPRATRKSQIFHTNHMLGTLDFTVSEHWAPFNFP